MGFFSEFLENLLNEESVVEVIDNPDYLGEREAEKNFKAFARAFFEEREEIEQVVVETVRKETFDWKTFLETLFNKVLIAFPFATSFEKALIFYEPKITKIIEDTMIHNSSHLRSTVLTTEEQRELQCFTFLTELFIQGVIAIRNKG